MPKNSDDNMLLSKPSSNQTLLVGALIALLVAAACIMPFARNARQYATYSFLLTAGFRPISARSDSSSLLRNYSIWQDTASAMAQRESALTTVTIRNPTDTSVNVIFANDDGNNSTLTAPANSEGSLKLVAGRYNWTSYSDDRSIRPSYGDATFQRSMNYKYSARIVMGRQQWRKHLGD